MAEMGLIITDYKEERADGRQNISLKFVAFSAPGLCIRYEQSQQQD